MGRRHVSLKHVTGSRRGVYVGSGHDVKSGDMIKVRHSMEIVQYDSTDVAKGEVNSKQRCKASFVRKGIDMRV